jgi:AraC-like DNA-binding protein
MKKQSFIIKQFLVVSVLIIVPIIIITFIFNYSIMQYSEAEISKSGMGKLDGAKSITGLLTQTVNNDAIRLSINQKLSDLYGKDDIKTVLKSGDNLMFYHFQDMLLDIVRTSDAYSSVYLYLDNSNYMMTSNGVYEKDDFQDKVWIDTYLQTRGSHNPISWTNPRASDTNGNNYVLSYIFPLTPYTTKLRGSISINVYESALSDLINSNNSDRGDFISIIGSNGNVISSVDKTLIAKNISNVPYISKILKSDKTRGSFLDKINGKKYLITYLKTDKIKWTYVGVFSLDSLTKKVTALREMTIYITTALLILFILLSFVISRKLYNPVKKLVQDIKQRRGVDIIGNGNEFTLLAQTFDSLIKQEDQLFSTIEKNKKNLRENYLLSLLRGKPSDRDEQIGLFPSNNFICCVLYIDKYSDFVASFSYEQQYYLKTIILNLTETTLGESFTCSGIVLEGDKIVVVVNTSNGDFNYVLSVLRESFIMIQQEAAKVIETTITVCVGGMYDNILKIRTSYIEAQNLLKRRFILGYQSLIFMENNNSPCCNKYFYPFNIERQILNNVDIGAKDTLLNSLGNFFDEVKQRDLSYDNIMLILNQLLGSTIKYLLELNISVSKIFGSDFNIYSELAENETLDQAGLFLSNIYLQIIEYCEKFKLEGDGRSHINKIIDYIHKNYKKDIAINTLADHVGLSYSHVRKIFNDETGENIVNYINNMRIEEAQRLLSQTNMNINDIALSLGYNNKQSFTRFFKKYVGINPGEYRNIKSS